MYIDFAFYREGDVYVLNGRTLTSRAWVQIDLNAIANNVRQIKKRLPSKALFMAVVKANAYGHGSVPVASAALEAGADWLGVATVDEGVELREGGIQAPILILGLSHQDFAEDIVKWDLIGTICTEDEAKALSDAGIRYGKVAQAHLKIDTGMGRIGLRSYEVIPFLMQLKEIDLPALNIDGIFTHFATADEEDKSYTLKQVETFQRVITEAHSKGFDFRLHHAANSAAALYLPQTAMGMVRVGISLYGLFPENEFNLIPALQFKTRVAHIKTLPIKESISYGRKYIADEAIKVATLSVGYADGYSRSLSNRGEVILNGSIVPIIGNICMDQCMVKVPNDLPVAVGDEAILIGRQGVAEITANDVANKIGTISYEVVSGISNRVKRVYYNGRRSDL
jgi:alanine racemase